MNLDIELLGHLIHGDLERLSNFNLPDIMLGPKSIQTINFLKEYVRQHSKIPSEDTVFQEMGFRIEIPQGDYEYTIQKIYERSFHQNAKDTLNYFAKLLSEKDYNSIETQADLFADRIRKTSLAQKEVDDLFSKEKNEKVFDQYLDRKAGRYGIITPWPTLNDLTWGWQGGDLVIFGSRSGVGKTFLMLHMAIHASFVEGKKVLFISPEMSRISIVNRAAALRLKISYEKIRKGQLDYVQELEYKKFILEIENKYMDKFFVFSDEFEMNIENLKDVVAKIRPNIIFTDGIYLLKTKKERDRMKSAPIISDELKMMAKRFKIPIICSTQLNREAIKLKVREITQGHLALSDSVNWNADWVFVMGRDEKEKENRQMIIRPLKTREGDFHGEIMLNWDFQTHNFSEYKKEINNDNLDIPF